MATICTYKVYNGTAFETYAFRTHVNAITTTDTKQFLTDEYKINGVSLTNEETDELLKKIHNVISNNDLGKEFYFCCSELNNEKLGFVRLYNIDYNKKVLTFGSFLLKENHPKLTALESMIIMLNISFDYLNMEKVELDVRINNEHAKHFYQRFGFVKTKENNIDEFYEMTR